MKKILVLILIFTAISGSIKAQDNNISNSVVICDDKVDSLLNLHKEYNQKHPVIQGYRIQILKASGNEALEVIEKSKSDFYEKYKTISVYLTFDEPDYRVRVGDFRTRLEAEKFLKKIIRKYPGAWVIQDDINFPDLPKYTKNKSYE